MSIIDDAAPTDVVIVAISSEQSAARPRRNRWQIAAALLLSIAVAAAVFGRATVGTHRYRLAANTFVEMDYGWPFLYSIQYVELFGLHRYELVFPWHDWGINWPGAPSTLVFDLTLAGCIVALNCWAIWNWSLSSFRCSLRTLFILPAVILFSLNFDAGFPNGYGYYGPWPWLTVTFDLSVAIAIYTALRFVWPFRSESRVRAVLIISAVTCAALFGPYVPPGSWRVKLYEWHLHRAVVIIFAITLAATFRRHSAIVVGLGTAILFLFTDIFLSGPADLRTQAWIGLAGFAAGCAFGAWSKRRSARETAQPTIETRKEAAQL